MASFFKNVVFLLQAPVGEIVHRLWGNIKKLKNPNRHGRMPMQPGSLVYVSSNKEFVVGSSKSGNFTHKQDYALIKRGSVCFVLSSQYCWNDSEMAWYPFVRVILADGRQFWICDQTDLVVEVRVINT